MTIAERPELLREAYPLGVEGWADMATAEPVDDLARRLARRRGDLPGGSFVALAGGEIVGYSGLCRCGDDDADGRGRA